MSDLTSKTEPTIEADFTFDGIFSLTSGEILPSVTLHYAMYGALNEARNNAILVPHALSGSARVADWWTDLFGEYSVFDLSKVCVIGINMISSCYGSTGPTSINPVTNQPYGRDFPLVSVKDNVRAQAKLIQHLGIEKLKAVIGGSIGGMQALQWAVDFPDRIKNCIAVGAAPLDAMGLALNHLQREAILQNPEKGLSLARQIAMCSYKSSDLFAERYARNPNRNGENPYSSFDGRFDVGGYLNYQGEIFYRRFNTDSYLFITKLMDNFDLSLGYDSLEVALNRIRAKILLVGIESDWLFPTANIKTLTAQILTAGADASYQNIFTNHGHDGFLAEPQQLVPIMKEFLR